jgi:tartronate-semialdehyde synthase
LGLIRQAQRAFDMDYCVQLAFDNINMPEADNGLRGYGVDHVTVAEGLGCKAIRVTDPADIGPAFARAAQLMAEHRVPVVIECILERVTNIAMGAEIDKINEFEPIEDRAIEPDEAALLD